MGNRPPRVRIRRGRYGQLRRVFDAAGLLPLVPPDGAVLPGVAQLDTQERGLSAMPLRARPGKHAERKMAGEQPGGEICDADLWLKTARRSARQLLHALRLPRKA